MLDGGISRDDGFLRAVWILFAAAALGIAACHPPIASTLPGPPSEQQLSELWVQPEPGRDLFWGVGGKRIAPDPDARYTVIEIKRSGFSRGYTVKGPADREWSAKFPPEAATEVTASRILWGVGYHQPPIYYVAHWNAEKATSPNPQLPARFREKKPDLDGLDAKGVWSYYSQPVRRHDTALRTARSAGHAGQLRSQGRAERDLRARRRLRGGEKWYVARDLGQTFGRTGVLDAPRGDIQVFEQTPFIKGVVKGHVVFDYRGRHHVLFENIRPADVRWICTELDRFTDDQWQDAFRAGGYPQQIADRFIARMKQKIHEGLALKD